MWSKPSNLGIVSKLDDENSHLKHLLSEQSVQADVAAMSKKLFDAMSELNTSRDAIFNLRRELENLSEEKISVEVEAMKLAAEVTALKGRNERHERDAQNEEALKLADELIQVQKELADAVAENGRLRKEHSVR